MSRILRLPADMAGQLRQLGMVPRDLVVYVNSACNLRCRHCYLGNDLLDLGLRVEAHSALHAIRSLAPLERLTIVGGEPLLHPQLDELLEGLPYSAIREARVTTNLTTVSKPQLRRWSRLPLRLCVSIDGASAEEHDYVRGAGSFARSLANLRSAVQEGCDVEVTHSATNRSLGAFLDLLTTCHLNGVSRFNLHRVSAQGNALKNQELLVTPTQWVHFTKALESLSLAEEDSSACVRLRYPPLFTTIEGERNLRAQGLYHDHAQGSFYGSGDRVVIYPDGKLFISSEAFGTEAFIARIQGEAIEANTSIESELALASGAKVDVSAMNPNQTGDSAFPVVLSVSFKRELLIPVRAFQGAFYNRA